MLYVGEGDPIRPCHYAQKDFWTRAIGFTAAAVVLARSANGRPLKEIQEAEANL